VPFQDLGCFADERIEPGGFLQWIDPDFSISGRLGGDPCRVDPRVDLGLDRLVSVGVDSRVDT
jgi:hypothetical protein